MTTIHQRPQIPSLAVLWKHLGPQKMGQGTSPPGFSTLTRTIAQYVVALVFVVLATLLRMLLDPVLGEEFPFIPYLCAIGFSFWVGGLGPSIATLVLGFLATGYFFLHPRGSVLIWNFPSQIGAVFYLIVGGSTIWLMELFHAARLRATASEEEMQNKQVALEAEIHERRQAQEAYITLLRKMVSIQEVERQRISRELHDQCGQDLTALDIGLKIIERTVPITDEGMQRQIRLMHDTLGRVTREVHDLALELRPPSLDDLGLRAAVKSYLDTWSAKTAIAVDFESRGLSDRLLAPDVETAIYRVLVESLTNVAKHARVERVSVILEIQETHLVLIVEDQGAGFDLESQDFTQSPPRRLGLLGMRERLQAVNGSLEIESAPDAGTTIFVKVPLGAQREGLPS